MKEFYYWKYLLPLVFLLMVSSLLLSSDVAKPDNANVVIAEAIVDPLLGVKNHESAISSSSSSSPLKIFVMVGQSNTDGHGYVDTVNKTDGRFLNGTLEWLVETNPDTYGKLKTYDKEGALMWKERNDVMITYNRQNVDHVRPEWNKHGPLVAGYGFGGGDWLEMGPELGFGWLVGDALGDDGSSSEDPSILLLKVSWGGRSLAVNYRPPSSGGTTGLFYEAMLANVYKTLANLPKLIPGYTIDRGYEISGFAWHQGWNDGCDANMTAEYESNLANLIRDVRTDLGVPDLPVSIGVSGMNGWQPGDDRRTQIVDAQLAVADVAKYPEFEGTVASVETRDFYREVSESPGNQIYHWNNNCESYWLIGQAMGEAMVKLLRNKDKKKTNIFGGGNESHKSSTSELRNVRSRNNK